MEFDYNSTRPKLILAEYGRNVQNMVDYICTLPTKEERNRYAQVVIDMMGVLNPHLRDVSDFKHKLWDHLHIISDFKIDVDSPYPVPTRDEIQHKPDLLDYPQHRIRFKHYGFTVERMIEKAKLMPTVEAKQKMAISIANFMKMAYMTWNKDSVQDDHIIHDLTELSGGELQLPADTVLTKVDFKTPPPGSRVKTQGTNTNQKSNNNNNSGHGQSNSNYKKQYSGGGSGGGGKKNFVPKKGGFKR
ncbi:DUF4290 domain-containing protein [Sphingobacterium psychroaquaticum]|uniref:Uncharacterized protein n=1 Tax=Sphingobacterium psychroaquaticum TaxID=561061 RepID=A0A1X7JJ32_9SPHI|nr:DUF4290 domain-containing protein [Sphingobacterium psychroaquaticum]QBQ40732.1 DUF4290 domain-containing protein [Sphingobacterium psychroaquaticum]SMG28083.1 protein of unknown function [Sphingobacterium psychroaquaticum]